MNRYALNGWKKARATKARKKYMPKCKFKRLIVKSFFVYNIKDSYYIALMWAIRQFQLLLATSRQ